MNKQSKCKHWPWMKVVLFLSLALIAGGCGRRAATVTGRVTHQGQPVILGSVVFVGEDGKPRSFPIKADGTYIADQVWSGEARLAVFSDAPQPAPAPLKRRKAQPAEPPPDPEAPPEPVPPPPGWFPIPAKYNDITQSDLKLTILPGSNVHDIDLP